MRAIKYIARIIIETTSAFHLGSGDYNYDKGSLVQKDWNGLPYIPGTSIAGMIRHSLGIGEESVSFGYSKDEEAGMASHFIFSAGLLLGGDQKALESVSKIDDEFLQNFLDLPTRDFVAIDHMTGNAKDKSLRTSEIVFKGSRFGFLIEYSSDEKEDVEWTKVISLLNHPDTVLGGGSRKGFGMFKIKECKTTSLDLRTPDDLEKYLGQSFSFNADWSVLNSPIKDYKNAQTQWKTYELKVSSKTLSTLIFGSDRSSENADKSSKQEVMIEWDADQFDFCEKYLIPGTSIKGILRHRILQMDRGASTQTTLDGEVRNIYSREKDPKKALYLLEKLLSEIKDGQYYERSKAVTDLFGSINDDDAKTGNVIVEDKYLDPEKCIRKVFTHVATDRFSGAPISGALFQEEVIIPKEDFSIFIHVNEKQLTYENSLSLLKTALDEIADGSLAIGAMSSKGHGEISGEVKTN